MEVRKLAERILFGSGLSDKLAGPAPGELLTDSLPGPALPGPPRAPGRPVGLELRPQRELTPFPARGRLHEPAMAGTALHAFANHELLALELMALVLLRFPDADPRFRRELVATLRDEQRHLALYIERMEELGVGFGDAAASPFFWDCLAGVQGVEAFVAGMSLTLEQANLDFAEEYAEAFAEAGDQRTAALLERVHREEIVHVARGVQWFARHRPERSLWDAWREVLPPPLTPRRARGPRMAMEARRKAGMGEEYIERVRWFAHSRGRRPDLYLWNPGCEDEIAAPGAQPSQAMEALRRDLQTLPVVFAGEDDQVLVDAEPSREFMARLAAAGFSPPCFVLRPPEDRAAVRPWGWSPGVARVVPGAEGWSEALRPAFDKRSSARWFGELAEELGECAGGRALRADAGGQVCVDPEEAWERARAFRAAGFPHVVLKAPFGASGRNQLRWLDEPEPTPAMRAWARRIGACRVEPWLERVVDLSFHFDADGEGGLAPRGVTRFRSSRTGRFERAWVSAPTRGMAAEGRRFLSGDGRDARWLDRVLAALARGLGPRLEPVRGPVGVDAMLCRDPRDGALVLHPLLEVNPRFTFGRVALKLRGQVAAGRTSTLALVSPEEAKVALARPLVLGPGRALREGAVALNDPATAARVVALWTVG